MSYVCPKCNKPSEEGEEHGYCRYCHPIKPTRHTIKWLTESIWTTHSAAGQLPDGTRFKVEFFTTGNQGGSSWVAMVTRIIDGAYRRIDGPKGGVDRARKELAELLREMADHPNEAWLGAFKPLGGQFA